MALAQYFIEFIVSHLKEKKKKKKNSEKEMDFWYVTQSALVKREMKTCCLFIYRNKCDKYVPTENLFDIGWQFVNSSSLHCVQISISLLAMFIKTVINYIIAFRRTHDNGHTHTHAHDRIRPQPKWVAAHKIRARTTTQYYMINHL